MYDQEVQSHALVAEASSVCRAVVVEVDVEEVACHWWPGRRVKWNAICAEMYDTCLVFKNLKPLESGGILAILLVY